jgi:hypothetical protein
MYPVSPTFIFSRPVPLPESLAVGTITSMSYHRSFGSSTQRNAAIGIVREVFQFSGFSGLATAMAANVSITGRRDMLKRSIIFSLAAAAGFVVISLVGWFVLDADLHLKKANATASNTALSSRAVAPGPFKMSHAANQTTTRLLALDRVQHLAFWTVVLKNNRQVCDVVVRTRYQGGTESGVDNWSIGCQDGHKYSINVNAEAQDLVCTRNTFARRAE